MQRLPRLVELILLLILCGVIALWAVRMMRGDSIAAPPAADAGVAAGGGRVEQVLASARLFGSRRPGALSDNVRALGVVADASGRGSVIVSVDGQTPRVYRVGDTLDGRRVTAIHADEIELESGGARQVFRLPEARPPAQGLTIIGAGPQAAMPALSPATAPVAAPSAAAFPPQAPASPPAPAPSPYAAPIAPTLPVQSDAPMPQPSPSPNK